MNVSATTSHDKGTGRDTVVTRTRVRSSRRTCLGDWVIEDGRADRLYTSAGYCDVAGGRRAPAVAGAGDGTAAVQPELPTVDVDPHKHCGKELELFSGLGWYFGVDGSLLIGISLTINIDEAIQAFKSLFE